jgi:hypothetical protein
MPCNTRPYLPVEVGSRAATYPVTSDLASMIGRVLAPPLKKCLRPPVDVIVDNVSPLDAGLSYSEHPVKILGQQDRVMRRRMIQFFKVQWSRHSDKDATWKPRNSSF